MCTVGVGRGQAPDGVGVAVQAGGLDVLLVDVRLVAVEVQGQGLVVGDREDVVQAQVVLLHHVFVVCGVQRSGEVVGELVAAAEDVDRLQAATVTTLGALARFLGEAAGVQLKALDFLGGDQGTGEAFWQQSAIIVLQHWQGRHLVTVLEHGVGDAELHSRAGTGQVMRAAGVAVGVLGISWFEEVNASATIVALAAVQAYGIQAERVNAHAHGALGEAGGEVGDCRLAPFDLVIGTVFLVTVDVSVTQKNVCVAIFDKALAVGLLVGLGLGRGDHRQSDQADPGFQHLVFLIS
ncbi:hypothetical protein D3C81_1296840 [compost metagenome]